MVATILLLLYAGCRFNGDTKVQADDTDIDAGAGQVDERVTDDLIALYRFKEAVGDEFADVSGFGAPLDLVVVGAGDFAVTNDGLQLIGDTLIRSTTAASKIAEACALSNAISLEVWIRPASVAQTGPARIVGMSRNPMASNFVLAQGANNGDPESRFNARLKTALTGTGASSAVTEEGVVTTEWTHVVFTRAADDSSALYVNSELVGLFSGNSPASYLGALDTWEADYTLNLGDELASTGLSRTWHGEYALLAIYSRGLSAQEVAQNFLAGR